MLLVTGISILTALNTLTVLLGYTNLFKSHSQYQYTREELPILGLTLPYT